jgi:hypothetical protein
LDEKLSGIILGGSVILALLGLKSWSVHIKQTFG